MSADPAFLTRKDAARYLGISESSLRNLEYDNALPVKPVRLGERMVRYSVRALQEWEVQVTGVPIREKSARQEH